MSSVDDLAGTMLIGMFVAAILYGVTTAQTYFYCQSYPNDRTTLKVAVLVLWLSVQTVSTLTPLSHVCRILETIHTAFCIVYIYDYVIIHFGDEDYLNSIYWAAGVTVVIGVLVAGVVHSYYIKRIWIVSNNNKPLTAVLSTLAIMRFGFGMATGIESYVSPHWSVFQKRASTLATLSLALSSAASFDVLAAASLIYFLKRSRTGFKSSGRSDSRVRLIMIYAVNTGALTSLVSISTIITFASLPKALVFLGLTEILGKLYANSFLASINARRHIRNVHQDHDQLTTGGRSGFTAPRIQIVQETTRVIDDMPVNLTRKDKGTLI